MVSIRYPSITVKTLVPSNTFSEPIITSEIVTRFDNYGLTYKITNITMLSKWYGSIALRQNYCIESCKIKLSIILFGVTPLGIAKILSKISVS